MNNPGQKTHVGSSMVTMLLRVTLTEFGVVFNLDLICSEILGILPYFFKRLRSEITNPIWRHFSRDAPSRLSRVRLIEVNIFEYFCRGLLSSFSCRLADDKKPSPQ